MIWRQTHEHAKKEKGARAYRSTVDWGDNRVQQADKRGVAYSKKGDTVPAIADLNLVVKSDLSCPEAYFYRGVSYLQRKEWIKAKQDFTLARRGKVDIAHLFDEDFGGVVAFQQEQKFELPSDIVHLLKDG